LDVYVSMELLAKSCASTEKFCIEGDEIRLNGILKSYKLLSI